MSKKKLLFLLMGTLAALFLASCNCANSAVSVYEVLLDSPVGDTVVSSLNPSFDWHGSDTCEPDQFELYIRETHGNNNVLHNLPGDMSSYTLTGDSLLPGRQYYWTMMAVNDYDPEESGDRVGPVSDRGTFYTGPICSGETLVAPIMEDPYSNYHGNWITQNQPYEFKWSYPGGCLPVSYDYQFASDPGFADIVLQGTTAEPYLMRTFQSFPNCSSTYIRVAANDGSSVGPWSDAIQFHWVQDVNCWQNHYISDDAARIDVRLYDDICSMTRYNVPNNARLTEGCKREYNSLFVHGDGEFTYPPDHGMRDFKVELGSGPCPSTGLDKRKFGGLQYFYVIAPGTYCVSISKEQTADSWGTTKDLRDGTWTDPLSDETRVGKTIELGPGIQDVVVEFGWDEWDQIFLNYPIPENIHCRRGPDTICDPLKIPLAGEILPLLARDLNTEWKMTSYEGETCFVWLPSAQINEAAAKIPDNQIVVADLPVFEPQPPCPTPTPEPREPSQPSPTGCAQYTSQGSCEAAKCDWVPITDTSGICIPY